MRNLSRAVCLAVSGDTICGKTPVGAFAFTEDHNALPLCQEHFDWAKSCFDELDQIVAGVTS